MQGMKKRLRKKLEKKAIEELRRETCIVYRLPYGALFPRKPITGYKRDYYPFSEIIEGLNYEFRNIFEEQVIDK